MTRIVLWAIISSLLLAESAAILCAADSIDKHFEGRHYRGDGDVEYFQQVWAIPTKSHMYNLRCRLRKRSAAAATSSNQAKSNHCLIQRKRLPTRLT